MILERTPNAVNTKTDQLVEGDRDDPIIRVRVTGDAVDSPRL